MSSKSGQKVEANDVGGGGGEAGGTTETVENLSTHVNQNIPEEQKFQESGFLTAIRGTAAAVDQTA